MKPFNVRRWPGSGDWYVYSRRSGRAHGPFFKQGDAIDFCYKTWPWYL